MLAAAGHGHVAHRPAEVAHAVAHVIATHPAHVIVAVTVVHVMVVHPSALAVHVHMAKAAKALVRYVKALAAAVAARRPKISVITPTWQRARLLLNRCIPSVRAQLYDGEIEHIIVSDGPDPALAGVPGIVFLPEHVPTLNRGVLPRLYGTRLATGDLIAYLDDDNAWRPRHLDALASAIGERDVSFAYSQAHCRNEYGRQWIVGCARPVFGQIDTSLIMHRAGLLETADWRPSGRPADWDLVERWLRAGATWAHVPEITLDYYARSDPALAAI